MKIRSKIITENDLHRIAKSLGLNADGLIAAPRTRNGVTYSGRLMLDGPNNAKNQHHYGRINHRGDRHINAVCWHGFRDFMRECYLIDADAIIATGIMRYTSAANFEDTHEDTAYTNIGSQVHPMSMGDACHC